MMKRFVHTAGVYVWHAIFCAAIAALVLAAFWGFSLARSVHHRRQAERLLRELSALHTGAADFKQVERLAKEFGGKRDCKDSACRYEFENSFGMSLSGVTWTIRRTEWDHFRLRPWRVAAWVDTENGEVTDIEFGALVGRGRGFLYNDGLLLGNQWAWVDTLVVVNPKRFEQLVALQKEMDSASRTRYSVDAEANGILIKKPALEIGGSGEALQVYLDADATPGSRRVGFDIDLRCATALIPCTEPCHLAPSAWKSYVQRVRSNGQWVEEGPDCAR